MDGHRRRLNESPELIAQECRISPRFHPPYPRLNESPELIAQESASQEPM